MTIAILDANGIITDVNQGWRDFGAANGLVWSHAGLGENYLRHCTPEQSDRLRELIAGRRYDLSCLYPCHNIDRARWMVVVAVPLTFEPPTGLLLMHFDITTMMPPGAAAVRLEALPGDSHRKAVALARIVEQATLGAVALERMRHAAPRERPARSSPAHR
ncbi:hypothetical protein [Rhodoplanes roseus]|uniref:PAS fold-4 domain-containing protein n=1 Tax=Rhodoplanes roseus TaxID=29409 RepID=A0A327KZM1_9BRAD|nr:hypothetical protein [Rhodoplanes roseus]RAI43597.1 hypothetical protein CH341_13445 [Rhodoplanes roseus]